MKIERYISVLAVLVVGLFLVNAYWPAATFAKGKVQCYVPANSWSVPATAGPGTVCTTYVPSTRVPACSVVTAAETPLDVIASILRLPFDLGECILGRCPQSP
ncbi:MAG: hypothetical protein WBG50_20900 [Desulfomonilaceae bacterium]